jgi:hypothetical protein
MGIGSKIKKGLKKVGKAVKKAAPVVAAVAGFAIGGPAGAAAGFSLGSTAASISKQKGAEKKQRKAAGELAKGAAVQNKLVEIANARARRQAIAEARQVEAAARVEAAAGGALESSAFAGATASLQSQLAETFGFSRVQEQAGQQVAEFEASAARLQTKAASDLSKAATYSALAELPGQLGFTPSFASALDFSTNTTPTPTYVPGQGMPPYKPA